MHARQKLNRAALNGCVLLAGVIGLLAGSWIAFAVALAVAAALAAYSGDIRMGPQSRHR